MINEVTVSFLLRFFETLLNISHLCSPHQSTLLVITAWPPKDDEYNPKEPGWRKIFQRRYNQIDMLSLEENSYNGYMSAVYAGMFAPNHTEYGYGLTKAPSNIVRKIKESFMAGRAHAGFEEEESAIDVPSRFVPLSENLKEEALGALKPILESWSGVKLEGTSAYGLRVYQHNATLLMHLDKSLTHVISTILHIDHDDSANWPLVIEVSSSYINTRWM